MRDQITNDFCDAGVLVGVGYRTYSVPGGLGYNACESFALPAAFGLLIVVTSV